jgi:CubicO group peptidase (beta-lactamase class C family)
MSNKSDIKELNQMLSNLETLKSGVLAIYKDKLLLFEKITGYRDLPNELPIDKDTSFSTASLGKIFVALGIIKLIEDNLLNFSSQLKDLITFDLKGIDGSITIEQLLTHTSNIPNYFDTSITDDYAKLWEDYPNYKIRSPKDLLPLFIDKPMKRSKGKVFEYSDSGFVMLSIVIEELTKSSFDNYLEEIIFKPLSMNCTGYYELDRLPNNCATNYIFDKIKNQFYSNIYSIDVKGTGAGGAFTSVNDMNRFWHGLFDYKIISKPMLKNMLTPSFVGEDFDYGLGVWLDKSGNPFVMGSDPGLECYSHYSIETTKQFTIISNYADLIYPLFLELIE